MEDWMFIAIILFFMIYIFKLVLQAIGRERQPVVKGAHTVASKLDEALNLALRESERLRDATEARVRVATARLEREQTLERERENICARKSNTSRRFEDANGLTDKEREFLRLDAAEEILKATKRETNSGPASFTPSYVTDSPRQIERVRTFTEPRIWEAASEGDESEDDETEILDNFKIEYLYHITHVDNLPGIMRNGLLSHNKAHESHDPIDISMQNVNSLRSRRDPIFNRSLHDYVPLYFNAKNPMLYKRKYMSDELAIIHFSRELLLNDNVLFTDGNAASSATCFYDDINDLDEVEWDAIWSRFWHDIDDGKRKRCAEVLVPKKISAKHVEKIAVSNKATLKMIDGKTRNKADCVVDWKLFSWNDSRSNSRKRSEYGSSAWA